MERTKISVAEVLGSKNALTRNAGEKVYQTILQQGGIQASSVLFDFSGIAKLTTGFCHAAIGPLFLKHPSFHQSRLQIQGYNNPVWDHMIEEVITLATHEEVRSKHQALFSELLEA